MIKLPRTGYPVPKYQFGSQVSTVCIKIMPKYDEITYNWLFNV